MIAASFISNDLAQNTRSNRYTHMRRMLMHLALHGLNANLVGAVPRTRAAEPRQRTVKQAELQAMLAKAPDDLRLYIMLCSDLALRSGTAVRIAPCHRTEDGSKIRIDKIKYGGSIVMPLTAAIKAVLDWLDNNGAGQQVPYLQTMHRKMYGRSIADGSLMASFQKRFAYLARGLGIANLRSHDLRRTTAEKAYNETRDVRVVQGILGHASLAITTRYLQRDITAPQVELMERIKTA